jgi:hypothetical protein
MSKSLRTTGSLVKLSIMNQCKDELRKLYIQLSYPFGLKKGLG